MAFLVVAAACSIITIKTLVGYSDFGLTLKVLISVAIFAAWFAPLLIGFFRLDGGQQTFLSDTLSFVGYTLFGFVFILFCFLILRDVVWYSFYGLAKLFRMDVWSINPTNISALGKANFIVMGLSLIVTGCALYEGLKNPEVKEITISSPKLSRDLRIVHLTDLHINRLTSVARLRRLVYEINQQNPDVILMTGDIIDDDTTKISSQLNTLIELSAPYGVYSSMGNHEFYNGINSWTYSFKKMGFHTLFNRGVYIANSNIFVSGIPDTHTACSHPTFAINFENALKGSKRDDFRILLSHNPELVDNLTAFNYQLMLSGHTHGGQIFPFHLLVKKINNYLAGRYKVNGIDLYVSRGAGTWGPAMRLFAPSEITVFNLEKSFQ